MTLQDASDYAVPAALGVGLIGLAGALIYAFEVRFRQNARAEWLDRIITVSAAEEAADAALLTDVTYLEELESEEVERLAAGVANLVGRGFTLPAAEELLAEWRPDAAHLVPRARELWRQRSERLAPEPASMPLRQDRLDA